MIISPKPRIPLSRTGSSLAHVLPTPTFSPLVERLEPVVPQESYTILRTLHRTQTSNLSLAVSSGCPTLVKKATLRHALYAIRTHRLPLSRGALAERTALEVLSIRNRGGIRMSSMRHDSGMTARCFTLCWSIVVVAT